LLIFRFFRLIMPAASAFCADSYEAFFFDADLFRRRRLRFRRRLRLRFRR
jgi:hypothetical protein